MKQVYNRLIVLIFGLMMLSCQVLEDTVIQPSEPINGAMVISIDEDITFRSISQNVIDGKISDACFFIYDAETKLLVSTSYVNGKSTSVSGLVNGRNYNVYVLANVGDISSSVKAQAMDEDELVNFAYVLDNYADIVNSNGGIPFAGKDSFTAMDGKMVTIAVANLAAKLTVKIDKSLNAGVTADVTSLRLCNSSKLVYPFGTIQPTVDADFFATADFATSAELAAINAGTAISFYGFENKKGTTSNASPKTKVGDPLATYIEMKAHILGDGKSADATYSWYVGANNVNDFNMERGHEYILTLKLNGDGFTADDLRVNADWHYFATGITLAPAAPELEINKNMDFTATVAPASIPDAYRKVNWSLSNYTYAQIVTSDENGTCTIKGLAEGTTTLIAESTTEPGVIGTAVITVVKPPINHITMTVTKTALIHGESTTVTAVAYVSADDSEPSAEYIPEIYKDGVMVSTTGSYTFTTDFSTPVGDHEFEATVGTLNATETVTVSKQTSVAKELDLTVDPVTVAQGGTVNISAIVIDQYGEDMHQTVALGLKGSSVGNNSYTWDVPASEPLGSKTVTATCGALSKSKDISVVAYTPIPKKIVFTSPSPASGVVLTAMTVSAKVVDQYDNDYAGDVAITGPVNGTNSVSWTPSTAGTYTFTASYSGLTNSIEIIVSVAHVYSYDVDVFGYASDIPASGGSSGATFIVKWYETVDGVRSSATPEETKTVYGSNRSASSLGTTVCSRSFVGYSIASAVSYGGVSSGSLSEPVYQEANSIESTSGPSYGSWTLESSVRGTLKSSTTVVDSYDVSISVTGGDPVDWTGGSVTYEASGTKHYHIEKTYYTTDTYSRTKTITYTYTSGATEDDVDTETKTESGTEDEIGSAQTASFTPSVSGASCGENSSTSSVTHTITATAPDGTTATDTYTQNGKPAAVITYEYEVIDVSGDNIDSEGGSAYATATGRTYTLSDGVRTGAHSDESLTGNTVSAGANPYTTSRDVGSSGGTWHGVSWSATITQSGYVPVATSISAWITENGITNSWTSGGAWFYTITWSYGATVYDQRDNPMSVSGIIYSGSTSGTETHSAMAGEYGTQGPWSITASYGGLTDSATSGTVSYNAPDTL